MPNPTNDADCRVTMQFGGGMEVYNERSLCTKLNQSGVQPSFYKYIPSTQVPMGDMNLQGEGPSTRHAQADYLDAMKE